MEIITYLHQEGAKTVLNNNQQVRSQKILGITKTCKVTGIRSIPIAVSESPRFSPIHF